MKEYFAQFFSSYIYTQLVLLPFYLLAAVLLRRKVSWAISLGIHKILLLVGILGPLLTITIPNFSSPTHEKRGESVSIEKTLPVIESKFSGDQPNERTARITAAAYPAGADFIFFLAELILFFSMMGILIFLMKWTRQFWGLRKLAFHAQKFKQGRISLYRGNRVSTAFSVGILFPKIFLPENLKQNELEAILGHEKNHLRLKHHFWHLFETFLSHLFWYNPFTHWLHKKGELLREFECDHQSAQSSDALKYSKILVASAEKMLNQNNWTVTAQYWIKPGTLKQRVEQVLAQHKRPLYRGGIIFLALGAVLCFGVTWGLRNLSDDYLDSLVLEQIRNDHEQVSLTRKMVSLQQVPPSLIKVLLIHEDRHFFDHEGVHGASMARATWQNIRSKISGGPFIVSGGSTITQQLAKSFLYDKKRSFKRKFREMKVARVLEKNFSKKEILQMYLNRVYFGQQAWGLADAAQVYFGKSYQNLSLQEAAMLIPFLEAPAKNNVVINPALAKKRQRVLLDKLN